MTKKLIRGKKAPSGDKTLRVSKQTLKDLTPRRGSEVKGGIKTCKTTSNGNQDPTDTC